jgi:dephospho-CoA kinase
LESKTARKGGEMPHCLGITGNIACGKTAVGQMLLQLGAQKYIDADAIVHQLYNAGEPLSAQIATAFGTAVIAADGSVDRQALGAIVFRDARAMRRLEQMVHPEVGKALLREIAQVNEQDIVIIDAVKLLEGGSGRLCESKWLILCPREEEIVRLMQRNGLDRAQAELRVSAQLDRDQQFSLVDEIIQNDGSLEQTRVQVEAALARYRARYLDTATS